MEVQPISKEMDELCRLCLADNCILEDMFAPSLKSTTLLEKISFSTSIQVYKADNLPTKICSDCAEQVERLYEFKQKCLSADSLLRKHVRLKQKPDTFVPSPQRSLAKGGCLETEDALAMDTSQTSSFKYESEMLHIEIKEEEDILDESTSSNSGNETGKDVNEQATPHKDAPALSKKDKRFTCQLCGKNFCNKFSLTRHKWSHSKTTTTCKYCNKIFKNRESRQRHEKMHEEGNRYQCHLCDKSYVSSTSHAAHVRKHTGECPYKCSECNATFYLLSSFERHVVKHRGVKEYECEICTASFWVPDDLRAHVNRMH